MFRRKWLKRQTLTRLVVHTSDGTSIDGVLAQEASDGLVIRHPKYLDAEGAPRLEGTVFIPRENVDFVQVLKAGVE